MAKAEYNENPSHNWVADTLKEDLADGIRDAGGMPESRVIEDAINEDLRAHEARKREAKPRIRGRRDGVDPAEELAEKLGWKFMRGLRVAHHKAVQEAAQTPWQRALIRRCRALIGIHPDSTWEDQRYLYPDYARGLVQEYLDSKSRSKGYKGLDDKDSQSKLSRFMEDMADRSVGLLGRWRVRGI
jgi:hypothetical protein